MGKWAAAAAISGVGGTGGAATLAAYSLGAFGGGSGKANKVGNASGAGSTSEEFQQGKQGRCFSANLNNTDGIFKSWVSGKTIEATKDSLTEVSQSNEVQWENDQASPVRGCVDYEWSTKDASGKQWQDSNFRLVWVLAKGNRAFSVYLTAKGKSDKSFDFDGIAHTFKRDGENSGWQVEKGLKMKQESKNLKNGDIKDKFPKNANDGDFKTYIGQDKPYWNFLNKEGNDLQGETKSGHLFLTFTSNSSNSLVGSWSPNLSTWWEHFFDKSKWDMSKLIENIKGQWKV